MDPREEADMGVAQRITPCLWFDNQAEQAAKFYTGIFKNSRIVTVARYGEAGYEVHGRPAGSVMAVAFELDGRAFSALNGGPLFTFNEAISLQVHCETQEDVDYYWERLSEGGDPKAQQCGWLKDRYGLSWQVVHRVLFEMLNDPDSGRSQRAMQAMLRMKKFDIAELQRATPAIHGSGRATRTAGNDRVRGLQQAICAVSDLDQQAGINLAVFPATLLRRAVLRPSTSAREAGSTRHQQRQAERNAIAWGVRARAAHAARSTRGARAPPDSGCRRWDPGQ
jgi:predicted 3-demethylubiquinone-9 3-methyltransferase (glyoxalase superfamily)